MRLTRAQTNKGYANDCDMLWLQARVKVNVNR